MISFHCYASGTVLEKFIKTLLPYGRPMVCTEYMRRPISTFEEAMPIFKKYNVGAINFGLTAGKCNFHYPWNKVDEKGWSIPWAEEPEVERGGGGLHPAYDGRCRMMFRRSES